MNEVTSYTSPNYTEGEEWRKIETFDGYSVSNLGRVRRDEFRGVTVRRVEKKNGRFAYRRYPLYKKELIKAPSNGKWVTLYSGGVAFCRNITQLRNKAFRENN